MARFDCFLGLKIEPGSGQELLQSCFEKPEGILEARTRHMWRTYIRMGEKLDRIRQPDRNDDAARRVDPEKGRIPRLWSESCSWSCCPSTRFSKTRFPRLRNRRIRAPIQRKSRLNMARSYTRSAIRSIVVSYRFCGRPEFWRGTAITSFAKSQI